MVPSASASTEGNGFALRPQGGDAAMIGRHIDGGGQLTSLEDTRLTAELVEEGVVVTGRRCSPPKDVVLLSGDGSSVAENRRDIRR